MGVPMNFSVPPCPPWLDRIHPEIHQMALNCPAPFAFRAAHARINRDLDPEISTTEDTEGRRMDGCSNEFLRASVSSVVG